MSLPCYAFFRRVLLLLLGILLYGASFSQEENPLKDISGKVTDGTSGQPIKGAVIRVARLKTSLLSKDDGTYQVKARAADTLTISHVGYKTQRIAVGDKTSIDIVLELSEKEMEEVVVIGYGKVKKTDLTGSVGTVNMDDVKKAPVSSLDQALAGRIAGVQVSANEGQPGAQMNIVIRGGNSLTQSNSPLYVIDGFPIEDPSLASINPDEIVSFTVLKDASATAIYGSRGANGVVVIQTRQGKAGKTQIRYDGSAGFQQRIKKMELMSPYEFVKYQLEVNPEAQNLYLTTPNLQLEDYRNMKGYDWQDMLFRNSFQQLHNLSISGGNAQTRFALSGSYVDQEGIMINSGYQRSQARFTLDHNANKNLKIGFMANYSYDKNYGQLASSQQNTALGYSTYTMYQTWGYRPITAAGEGISLVDDLLDEESNDMRVNPIISVRNEIRNQIRSTIFANAYATYTISKALEFTVRAGLNTRSIKNEAFYNSKTGRGFPSVNNTRGVNGSIYNQDITDWVNENTLNYRKSFGAKHVLDAVAGFTIQGRTNSQDGYASQQIPNEELGLSGIDDGIPTDIVSITSKNSLLSFLGRVNYTFDRKYLFTATFRADGSSKFAKENRWGYFPSGAFAWKLGEEEFIKKSKYISDAKLRVTYGLTGNNRVGDYARFSALDLPYSAYYSFDNQTPAPGIIPSDFGNQDLRWETTAQLDLGFDIGFFKDRVKASVDVYRKTTKDLLLNANIPNSSGFNKVYKNVGKIRNDGLEISLSTQNISGKKFSWTTDFNISFNSNKVLELSEGEESIQTAVAWTGDYNSTFLYLTKLGGPASAFYGLIWDGNYQLADFNEVSSGVYVLKPTVAGNGTDRSLIKPGDIKYRDVNGDGVANDMDFVVLGRTLPVHIGGLNNNFTYGNFSLNVFFQWSYGNNIYNANRLMLDGNGLKRYNLNQFASYANRWSIEDQNNINYRAGGEGPRGLYSSRTLEDGSYLRLKTVALSYNFPARAIRALKISSLQVFASAQNLVTWTNYSGVDPEVSVRNTTLTPGFDYSAYPTSRGVLFGLKAGF